MLLLSLLCKRFHTYDILINAQVLYNPEKPSHTTSWMIFASLSSYLTLSKVQETKWFVL